MFGVVDGNCAINNDDIQEPKGAYIIDQTRDYCVLVSNQWSGISTADNRLTNSGRTLENVPKFQYAFKFQNITDKIRNRRVIVSGESACLLSIHADKVYYIIALRRLII